MAYFSHYNGVYYMSIVEVFVLTWYERGVLAITGRILLWKIAIQYDSWFL